MQFAGASREGAGATPVRFASVPLVLFDRWSASASGLAEIFGKNRKARIEVAVVSSPVEARTVSTRSELNAAVRTLSAGREEAQAVSFDELLACLRSIPVSPGEWRQVVYAGAEPAVSAEGRDYAMALLARTLAEKRLRLSHGYVEAAGQPTWTGTLAAFGGAVSAAGPAGLIELDPAGWFEAAIPRIGPPEGFRLSEVQYRVGEDAAATIPWIWKIAEGTLPGVAGYEEFVKQRAAARNGEGSLTASGLATLLAVNPYDEATLRLAAGFAERNRDSAAAIGYEKKVLELQPDDGTIWGRLGLNYWRVSDGDNAERCLLRAREKNADVPESASILGDVHAARKDAAGAAENYREAVRREPGSTDLWLKLADASDAANRKTDATLALEEALKLKADLWTRRTGLVEQYLAAGDRTSARRHLQTALPLLPADAAVTGRFAGYWETAGEPKQALSLWRRTVELDPKNETAYYSAARLLGEAGAWEEALGAAEAGVKAAPGSARLIALQADALTATRRIDEARAVLRAATEKNPDPGLLRRSADFEDRYGEGSAGAYAARAEALRAAGASEAEWRPAAERGLRAALRDGDNAGCRKLAGMTGSRLCAPEQAEQGEATVMVPGGFRALLFIARGPEQSSAEAFVADYSRTIVRFSSSQKAGSADAYRERLVEYFRLLGELQAKGKSSGGKTVVRLSLEDRNSSRLTEQILSLLGWRTRRDGNKTIVEPAEKGKRAKRQDLASALLIDLIEMQERLQAPGGEFALEIENEAVEIFPEEKMWQEQFYRGERYAGGFAEALARNPAMATLYAALSDMERDSATLLVQSVGMKTLAEKYGPLLALYSSCLEIGHGKVQVPGGAQAEAAWSALLHAQPGDPRKFLRAVLDKDDGKLIRFYFLLSQLDLPRQRFFTASAKRTTAFYEQFKDSVQGSNKFSRTFGSASIEDLLRELPIDEQGRMEFPGGPEVWMVAKTKSNSVDATQKRLKKLSRVTTPEVEDEILLDLIGKGYRQNRYQFEAWQNLLAAVRVETARGEPLDEISALLLGENFASTQGLFGYFSRLSALEGDHFREIFRLTGRIKTQDFREANQAAGLLHSMFYLYAAAQSSGRLPADRTAGLLLDYVKAMQGEQTPRAWAGATLDALGAWLEALGSKEDPVSLRDALINVPDAPLTAAGRQLNPGEALRKNYDRILQLQNVPRMDELLRIHRALAALAGGKGDVRAAAQTVMETAKLFREREAPAKVKIADDLENGLKSGSAARFASLNAKLTKELARKKISAENLRKIAFEYGDALAFRTLTALAGQVYAANFRAGDLLIAEDSLFLRKHSFVEFGKATRDYFPASGLEVLSTGAGSFARGGFDGIASVTGAAAVRGMRNADPNAIPVAAALLGTVRSAGLERVNGDTLRALAVQVHAAADWLVLAGEDERAFEAVSDATFGLLSLTRRARLRLGLKRHDWEAVWSSVSKTDLLFLAARLRKGGMAQPERSPAIAEYLRNPPFPERAGALGPALPMLRRNFGSLLPELAPYEDAAAEVFPAYLGERLAEFEIYLACLLVRDGLPAEALPALVEPAALAVLEDIQMSDYRDWQSVIAAYAAFDAARLREVLGTL